MDDFQENRKIPITLLEYLKQTGETFKVFSWILKELTTNQSKHWLKRSLTVLVIATVFQAIQPRLVAYIFDGLIQKKLSFVFLGLTAFFLCLLAEKLADFYQSKAREWILGLNWGQLDRRITELFFEKSLGQHVQESSNLSIANIEKGRWKILDLQGMLFFEGIPAILSLLFSYIFLWCLSPVAGAILTAVFAVYLVWMLLLNKKVVEICTPFDANFRKLNRHRVERWENIERVKTCSKEKEELTFLNGWFNDAIAKDRGFWLWYIKQCSLRSIFGVAGLVATMSYGAWLVWRGYWGIGLLYPLFSWTIQVSENIWRIGHIEHILNWNIPSVRSMINALSLKPDIVCKENAIEIPGAEQIGVAFDSVTHTYPVGEEENGDDVKGTLSSVPVLKNISFEIKPGEKVALIGSSGSGKTTIMRLLLRFMDPDYGSIRINGYDLREIKLDSWMACCSYIPQHAQILDGTIAYNLTYGLTKEQREKISDDELWRLMRLLKIDFKSRLTKGLDTLVGKNGIKLSGGQAQRVMIGAAAIKKPKFMIIDEATSHLDSSTEKEVHHGLAEVLKGEMGALVVAHRLSTVRDLCDKFIVLRSSDELKDGESQVEAIAGSFQELYAVSPTFRRLADDQSVAV